MTGYLRAGEWYPAIMANASIFGLLGGPAVGGCGAWGGRAGACDSWVVPNCAGTMGLPWLDNPQEAAWPRQALGWGDPVPNVLVSGLFQSFGAGVADYMLVGPPSVPPTSSSVSFYPHEFLTHCDWNCLFASRAIDANMLIARKLEEAHTLLAGT